MTKQERILGTIKEILPRVNELVKKAGDLQSRLSAVEALLGDSITPAQADQIQAELDAVISYHASCGVTNQNFYYIVYRG